MNKYIHSVLILLICFSCKEKTNDNTYTYTLKKVNKEIVLPIDSITSNYSYGLLYYKDALTNIEYLSMENRQTNDLNIFRLDSCSLYKKIKIELEGPNGIGEFLGHKVNSLNDIFIFNSNRETLIRIDENGNVFNRIKINSKKENLSTKPAASVNQCPMILIDSCLYFALYPISKAERNGNDLSNSPLCGKLNINSKEAKSFPLGFPRFWESAKSNQIGLDYSRIFDGKNFIYSFEFFDNILVTSDHINSQSYKITSRYMMPTKETPNYESMISQKKFFIEKPYYGNIHYDKYRNVYYRFAFSESEFPQDLTRYNVTESYKPFSIIIINSKFEIIGETLFPKNTYIPSMSFICEDGLCISTSNPNNTDYMEDIIKFECFELVKE